MKKVTMITFAAVAFAGVASADIAVGWEQTAPVWNAAGAGNVILPGVAQLVWSSADPVSSGRAGLTGLANANEVLLMDLTTIAAGQWNNSGASFVFDDVDVGGADINTGWIFTRIFETDGGAIAAGQNYIQVAVVNPSLPVYTNPDDTVNTPFYTDSVLTAPTGITSQGLTVIPEPATLGLMGVAGLGMFLARKKARR